MEEESFIERIFINSAASIIWCLLALVFAYVGRIFAKNGLSYYKLPLVLGMGLYGFITFVGLMIMKDDGSEVFVWSFLGLVILVIEYIRLIKEYPPKDK